MPSNGHSLTTAKTSNRSRWVFEDRARNLPCPSVYSVVIKAPPRCQFHHGTHGNARSGGTEAVEEKGLWDPQTTNTPLQTCDRFEQFSPTTFDWPLNGHEQPTAKTSNRSRWVFEDRARNLPCLSVYSVVKKAPPRRAPSPATQSKNTLYYEPHRLFGAYEVRITQ